MFQELKIKKLLVTGGAGFIGSHFVKNALELGNKVTVIDKLTYSGSKFNLLNHKKNKNFNFILGTILDEQILNNIFERINFDAIINFAAETHVDRSIEDSNDFIVTNVLGVQKLILASKKMLCQKNNFKFIQVSTDEVFGSITKGKFTEKSPYKPNSPYSASKAGGDHLVLAYFKTFNFPGIITNSSNNYGPNQFPEKLVPLTIIKALQNQNIPVYGNGKQIRDWLHVDDHCNALLAIIDEGKKGNNYLIGGNNCIRNIDMVHLICNILDKIHPIKNDSYKSLIRFVTDRPGHDQRYAVDTNKIKNELNWAPKVNFEIGLTNTIQWYINNSKWWKEILKNTYTGDRIGLKLDK